MTRRDLTMFKWGATLGLIVMAVVDYFGTYGGCL